MSKFLVLADGTEEGAWREARREVVTATDIARLALGGAGTWAAIRAEKEGRGRTFSTWATEHGHAREPFIAEYARSAFGIAPNKALVAAADRPEFAATPDGIGDTEVGEYKTTVNDWATVDDLPPRYSIQALWQMRVTGRRKARLVFEPHENGVPLYPFPRDFIIEYDAARVAELEAVAVQFLAGEGEMDEQAAEFDARLSAFIELDDIAAAARERAEAAKAELESLLGGKPLRFEGSVANLTRSADGTRRSFQAGALRQADPETYEKYTTETPVKGRLTITRRAA
jgi:hypothetical protein